VLSEVHPPTVPIRTFPETISDASTLRFFEEPAGPLDDDRRSLFDPETVLARLRERVSDRRFLTVVN
jgi:hypothetical protein